MDDDRRWVDDPRTTDELFGAALAELDVHDVDEQTGAIVALHERPTDEVLERAIALTRSQEADERRLGAKVLGQLNDFETGTPMFLDETMEVLLRLAQYEGDADVLDEVALAFAFRGDPRGAEPLLGWVAHREQRLRFALAFGASSVRTDDNADRIEAALVQLAADESEPIRDYARWSMRLLGLDSDAVRDALVAGTVDPELHVVAESLLGLALLRDPRGLDPLRAFLRTAPPRAVNNYGLEAAAAWADASLLPALHALEPPGPELSADNLAVAIEACETGVIYLDEDDAE